MAGSHNNTDDKDNTMRHRSPRPAAPFPATRRTVVALLATLCAGVAAAQAAAERDEFFWLSEINKATAVINAEQGLLDKATVPRVAAGIGKVIQDCNQPGGKRPPR